jgi:hypothetical protein
MYPDVEVEFADEVCWTAMRRRVEGGKYTWLIAGRTVYMVSPRSAGGKILHCEGDHVAPLLRAYLSETGQ